MRLRDYSYRTVLDDTDPRDFGGDIERDASYEDDYAPHEPVPLHAIALPRCAACRQRFAHTRLTFNKALRGYLCAACVESDRWLSILRQGGLL